MATTDISGGIPEDTTRFVLSYQRADGTWAQVSRELKRESVYTDETTQLRIPLAGVEAQALPIDDVIADFTVTGEFYTIKVSTAAGSLTITLGDPADFVGCIFNIKKISPDGNVMTIATTGNALIDSETSLEIDAQNVCVTLQCDGNNWWII